MPSEGTRHPRESIDAAIDHLRGEMAKRAEDGSWGWVDRANDQIRKLVETRNLIPSWDRDSDAT